MTASKPDRVKTGIYRHYKGKQYQVIGEATHSETLEPVVIYRALYGEFGLWVRPKAMFCENIIIEGREVPRFNLEIEVY
ncbi:DUF1653 domain-containing protein [Sporomusa malonica]|uniref:DUF1653 domain-containing protein n=1 Tax=Sporomusa malonica TaxID=112901 RepID=A0A1W2EF95_9FIRM|nr:DUF1653 domain-containing protein [Sporomusa malonica]SMD07976.1 Protein of unknown function [Sporomusa malonica]